MSTRGRSDIPCAKLGDEFRETVGRVHCLCFVELSEEREIWKRR